MTFEARLRAILNGGRARANGSALHIVDADAATLLLSADSSFNGFDMSPSRAFTC